MKSDSLGTSLAAYLRDAYQISEEALGRMTVLGADDSPLNTWNLENSDDHSARVRVP